MHPAMFIEALPGQWIRAGMVVGMEADSAVLGVMILAGQSVSLLKHEFASDEDAEDWGGRLRETLIPTQTGAPAPPLKAL